jgi:hypothetical protein
MPIYTYKGTPYINYLYMRPVQGMILSMYVPTDAQIGVALTNRVPGAVLRYP